MELGAEKLSHTDKSQINAKDNTSLQKFDEPNAATPKDCLEPSNSDPGEDIGDKNPEEAAASREEFEEDAEKDNFFIEQPIDEPGRIQLFEKGRQFEKQGNKDRALRCYLHSIKNLGESSEFPLLPQCLHQIASIYSEKEEYDKAVQFIKAEKLYYETTLIATTDVTEKQKNTNTTSKLEATENNDEAVEDLFADNPEILKANEFENLAKLCTSQGNMHLALEYCGKATKIRQAVCGENHPITLKSLDYFTTLYADVGRKQYEDAMKKFDENESEIRKAMSEEFKSEEGGDGIKNIIPEKNTIRFRGKDNPEIDPSKSTELKHESRQQQQQQQQQQRQQPMVELELPPDEEDDHLTTWLLLFSFFIVTVLLVFIIACCYCYIDENSRTCKTFRSELYYYVLRIQYSFNSLIKSGKLA